jgi:YYY domain-containing protein
VAVYTGLPTLLGWPWHETQQRSVADVGPVLQQRQQLIQNLYSGVDQEAALETLRLYGVEYVYIGQLERALYDANGLAKFDAMAQAGLIDEVYRQGSTRIYRVSPSGAPPGVLTTTLPVQTPTRAMPQPPAMLGQAVGSLPESERFGQFGLGDAGQQALVVVLWLLGWYVLAALGLPVAVLIFGQRRAGWSDGGWIWSRLIGLLLLGYCVWLPVSAGLWVYGRLALAIGLLLALAIAALAAQLVGRRANAGVSLLSVPGLVAGLRTIGAALRGNSRRVLWGELVWLAGFAAMLALRALNPDLWQPYWGGEKPFEFGLLNALVRSPVMPPYSPFFSDGTINYYYYGFFLMSMPIKAIGVAPSIGFNLVIPTLYALFAAGLFALGARISGRAWVGLAAVVAVALLGNLAAVFPAGWSEGIAPVLRALASGPQDLGQRLGSWFVGPSRVIPYTINEFPYWGFLFADLHPHLIAMPIGALALALVFELFEARQAARGSRLWLAGSIAALALAALALGTLAVTTSWDLPTYALLLAGGLAGGAWRRRGPLVARARGAALGAVLAALVTAGGLALYLPFFRGFVSPVGGLGQVTTPTSLSDYLLLYGVYLAVVAPVVIGAAWRLVALPLRRRRSAAAVGIVASSPETTRLPQMLLLLVVLLVVAAVVLALGQALATTLVPALRQGPAEGPLGLLQRAQAMLGPRVWAALLVVAAAPVVLSRRVSRPVWFATLLAVVAWLVSFAIEVVFLRDHLAGGDWYRMNTVFKFGLQIWVLLALAAALLLPAVARWLRRAPAVAAVPAGVVLALLVALGLVFPLAGTANRVAYRFPDPVGPTLDGLAFMDTAVYTVAPGYLGLSDDQMQPTPIELRFDGQAIRWLNTHIEGTPVVLQSSAEFYRLYGVRVAANTGLPTVVSPLHESEQRNSSLVAARDRDVQQIYRTTSADEALSLLVKYRVAYVYVGPIERLIYGQPGAAKFDMMTHPDQRGLTALDEVYRNEQVVIYQVRREVFSLAQYALQPEAGQPEQQSDQAQPPAIDQSSVSQAALEQLAAANPGDVSVVWQLAQQYIGERKYVEAADALARAASEHPDDVGLQQFYGDALNLAGRRQEAEAAYRQAIAANPSAGNYAKLAGALFSWGELDRAEEVYQQAATLDPELADTQCGLGLIEEQRTNTDRAIEYYSRCRDLSQPDSEMRRQAENGLERLAR